MGGAFKIVFMKKFTILFALLLCCVAASSVSAQPTKAQINAAIKRFPGVDANYMEQALAAKRVMGVAMPTWLPTGFKLELTKVRLGRAVAIEDREFILIYERTLENGRFQRFALEAGFDGLGGLPYDVTKVIPSALGNIDLMYEPMDVDGDVRLKDYAMTEWFNVGKTAFHYEGMFGYEPDSSGQEMISLADTEKILKSLKRL